MREQLDAFPEAAGRFCAERALFGPLDPPTGENIDALLALREAVDGYFRKRAGGSTPPDVMLADLLEAAALALRRSDPSSLAAATAHSALRLLSDDAARKLKICGHCGWLFIDQSRNRSRTWCDMAVCGNRAKASRHYRRKKEGSR